MRRTSSLLAAAAAAALAAGPSCYHDTFVQHEREHLGRAMPVELDPGAHHTGDIKVAKVRVWADADFRGHTVGWKRRVTDEIDYANQLLAPALGVRLEIVDFEDWDYQAPTAPLRQTLAALVAADRGDDVAWVIGFTGAVPLVTNAQHELGLAELLGKHLVVRGYSDAFERRAFVRAYPDIDQRDIDEVLGVRRRHKQTVLLLHELGHTLGAIHERGEGWILDPMYTSHASTISERNRALMQIAVNERVKLPELRNPDAMATALLSSIQDQPWPPWVAADEDEEVATLQAIVDKSKVHQTATDVPAAAYDQYAKAQSLAAEGKRDEALAELAPILAAYPGDAQIHLLECEIELGGGKAPSAAAQDSCDRAAGLAQGDPGPYFALAQAYAAVGDLAQVRVQLARAAEKIDNLPDGKLAAWAALAARYQELDDVTRAEAAAARAADRGTDVLEWARRTRARYGDPPDGHRWHVTADTEAAYIGSVRKVLDLIYAGKFGAAGKAARAADRRWPGAPGIAAARCDLAIRQGNPGAARAHCRAALAAFPGDSWALYLDGILQLRGRDPSPGIRSLRAAIAADPALGQAWRALAKALERGGQKAELEQLRKDYLALFHQPLP